MSWFYLPQTDWFPKASSQQAENMAELPRMTLSSRNTCIASRCDACTSCTKCHPKRQQTTESYGASKTTCGQQCDCATLFSAAPARSSLKVLDRGQAQVVQAGRHVAVALAREVLRTRHSKRISGAVLAMPRANHDDKRDMIHAAEAFDFDPVSH